MSRAAAVMGSTSRCKIEYLQLVKIHTAVILLRAAAGTRVSSEPPEKRWFYLDPKGRSQGPFSDSHMWDWYKAGYFLPTLMVRTSPETDFFELSRLFNGAASLLPGQQSNFHSHLRESVSNGLQHPAEVMQDPPSTETNGLC